METGGTTWLKEAKDTCNAEIHCAGFTVVTSGDNKDKVMLHSAAGGTWPGGKQIVVSFEKFDKRNVIPVLSLGSPSAMKISAMCFAKKTNSPSWIVTMGYAKKPLHVGGPYEFVGIASAGLDMTKHVNLKDYVLTDKGVTPGKTVLGNKKTVHLAQPSSTHCYRKSSGGGTEECDPIKPAMDLPTYKLMGPGVFECPGNDAIQTKLECWMAYKSVLDDLGQVRIAVAKKDVNVKRSDPYGCTWKTVAGSNEVGVFYV